MDEKMKGFYEFAEDDGSLPDGLYHLKTVSPELSAWEDGRDRLVVGTEVMDGEFIGNFGPRLTWSIPQRFEGVSAAGKPFVITEDNQKRTLASQVMAVTDGSVELTNPQNFDSAMLQEIAEQVEGREFYAQVKKNAKGYSNVQRVYALSEPPKGMGLATGFAAVDSL